MTDVRFVITTEHGRSEMASLFFPGFFHGKMNCDTRCNDYQNDSDM